MCMCIQVENGRVTVNGVMAVMGTRVFAGDTVTLDGKSTLQPLHPIPSPLKLNPEYHDT